MTDMKSTLLFVLSLLLILCSSGEGKSLRSSNCPEGPEPQCPFSDPELSVFYPHPNDCHWFYHCSNGVAYCKVCPADLHWNVELETCDYPYSAGCNGNNPNPTNPTTPKRTTTQPVPTTETEKPNTPEQTTLIPDVTSSGSTDECPESEVPDCPFPDPEFSVFFPHPNDCHWFYHCSNGVAYCKVCPADLHWNVELETCDYPYRAGCNGNNPNPTNPTTPKRTTTQPAVPTTETEKPNTPEQTTLIPDVTSSGSTDECPEGEVPDCPFPDPEFSVFFPHPNDCHWFYHCSNGVAYCKVCPADLHWNVELETCDYPYRAGCNGNNPNPSTDLPTQTAKPTTDNLPTLKTTPKQSTQLPDATTETNNGDCPIGVVPNCRNPDPELSVFFPHSNDCHWFYHCSNGVAYCKVCPAGLHWNVDLDSCDYPYRAGCDKNY